MDFKGMARRALNRGVRSAVSAVGRTMADPKTRAALGDVVAGKEPGEVLREYRTRARAERAEQGPHGASRTGRESGQAGRTGQNEPTGRAGRRAGRRRGGDADPREEYAAATRAKRDRPRQSHPRRPSGGYPGDFTGAVRPTYTPNLDRDADPGEIVWAWVPFEEDHSRGKDRPVLIIGREGPWLLGLMLTSKDNVPGARGEVRATEHARYINIGAGDWDAERRPSEVRLDRIIRIEDGAVRREGAIMPMGLFSEVIGALD